MADDMGKYDDPEATTGDHPLAITEGFADYLHGELRARGWTIRSFALRAGVDHSTVSKLMGGQRMPSLGTVQRIETAVHPPSASTHPLIRSDVPSLEPFRRVGHALRRDPVLDPQSVTRVLLYYEGVRSQSSRPPAA